MKWSNLTPNEINPSISVSNEALKVMVNIVHGTSSTQKMFIESNGLENLIASLDSSSDFTRSFLILRIAFLLIVSNQNASRKFCLELDCLPVIKKVLFLLFFLFLFFSLFFLRYSQMKSLLN